MHKVADEIQTSIGIPILHIADATANALMQDGIKRVGLLGTNFTMEQDFYKSRISSKYGIEVLVPEVAERALIHNVIYDELCLGVINETSKTAYLKAISALHERGAQAVILGCTEIALLVSQDDSQVPLYDTTKIHAEQAIALALADT